MLEELQTARKVVGVKQLRKALRENAVSKAFAARDAEERIVRPVTELCAEAGVELIWVPTMQELGAACGIEVGSAVAGLLK